MDCYHPYCPMSHLSHRPHPWNWNNVVSLPEAAIKPLLRPTISAALTPFGPLTTTPMPRPNIPGGKAALDRILELCPCLYTQIQETVSARGIVHLCEITLGTRINSSNVEQAFQIQHPSISTVHFLFPPATPGAGGGAIMEALCSEVLTNHNVPHMQTGPNGWPIWSSISSYCQIWCLRTSSCVLL